MFYITKKYFMNMYVIIAKREDRVNFPSAWWPAGVSDALPMSHHNQQRSVEETRSLLGGTHAINV
jgi:hypothetical protein